jgi:hypothetical protein
MRLRSKYNHARALDDATLCCVNLRALDTSPHALLGQISKPLKRQLHSPQVQCDQFRLSTPNSERIRPRQLKVSRHLPDRRPLHDHRDAHTAVVPATRPSGLYFLPVIRTLVGDSDRGPGSAVRQCVAEIP